MSFHFRWAACAALFLLPAVSPAADDGTVIVTATRVAETADETLSSVTVVSGEELRASGASSLMEALDALAGLTFTRSGGPGQQTSLFLRGTNSAHVLVLVDGVRMGSATAGGFAWEFVPVDQIERIEIVRGPRSAAWGADALGGVVQIFTRRGGGAEGTRAHARAGAGGLGTTEAGGGFSGRRGKARYSFQVSRFQTDGIDARQPTTGPFGVDQPDRDGFRNTSLSGRLDYDLSAASSAWLSLQHSEGNVEFDANGADETDFTQQVLSAGLRFRVNGSHEMRFTAGRSLDQQETFNRMGTGNYRYDTRRTTLNWENILTLGEALELSGGIDYLLDEVDSTTQYDRNNRDNIGAWLRARGRAGRVDLQAEARVDDNEPFGNHATGNIAAGLELGGGMRLAASLGTAFRAPSFNDLYFPGFSNPDLKPERSRSAEISLSGHNPRGRWRVSMFDTAIDDLIGFDALFIPQNIDQARIRGIELESRYRLGSWHLGFSATALPTLKDETTGRQLPRRSRRSARLELRHDGGQLDWGLSVIAHGPRFDDAANTVKLPGYAVVDAFAAYRLNRHTRLRLRADNLLDKEYQTAATYNTVGRTFFVSLEFTDL